MAEAGADKPTTARGGDRRGPERRQADIPFPGSDRRAGERRSGEDRRAKARVRLNP